MNIMTLGACLIVIGLLAYIILSHSAGAIIIIIGALLIVLSVRAAKRRAAKTPPITQRKDDLTASTSIQAPENPRVFFTHASRDKEKNISQLKDHFIVVDTETTGVNTDTDRIVSIAAAKYQNGVQTDRFYTLVNPGMHIPLNASEINGIFDTDVAGAPSEAEAMSQFAEFIGDAITGKTLLVAYNAPFDMKIISKAMDRSGIEGNVRCFDVLWYAKKKIAELKNYKQVTVAKHLHIDTTGAHQADCDCEMCAKILLELLKDA